MAGEETKKLSFDLILVIKPSNINKASPPADISNIGVKSKPANNPKAPSISKIIINRPNFFNLNLSNSVFIWDEVKYEIEYPIKDKLEIKTQVSNK